MQKPDHHILVCCSFRTSGAPQGVCNKKDAPQLLGYLENEIADRGLAVQVSSTGCLKVCDRGPAMVIYPDNIWYGGIESTDSIDEILDALEEGKPADKYVIA
ncbi:MAG: (2Fe-2S) ferredoxin domain-containing protein [Candidatus Goldbacteria bacterium]|nr:(2Fe-2S) ferredoxin domain-containing protein [Candidatus Goldiibacteriota bacterium]